MSKKRAKKKEAEKDTDQRQMIEPRKEGGSKMVVAIISIVITVLVTGLSWNKVKKYIPFFPRPLIRISYQINNNNIGIVFENIGSAPATYFTADITAKNGVFSINETYSDFELIASGQKGSVGSWTVISARNILPQQKGAVTLVARDAGLVLNVPRLRSDSRCKFVGTPKMKWGPAETKINMSPLPRSILFGMNHLNPSGRSASFTVWKRLRLT